MSYAQVQAILDSIDKESLEPLFPILDLWDEQEEEVYDEAVEELARSIYYVLYNAVNSMRPEARKEWRERLTDVSVRDEIAEIFWEEGDEDE